MEEVLRGISRKILEGKVTLVLGAGASVGATLPEGKEILLGDDLKNLLCDKFLSGKFKDFELKYVSDMAISESSLFDVQDFIRDYFQGIEPSDYHAKIPNYKWRAIFTTNYDRLIEVCYERNLEKVQAPELILTNNDRFDEARTDDNLVPLVKLHGCITRTRDEKLPLILTVDQYNDSLVEGRDRLFKMLFDIAYENTIIFVGHGLQDHNLRAVMSRVRKEVSHGQRHYLLRPGIDDVESRFWAQSKVTGVNATFQDLLESLEKNVTKNERALLLARPNTEHPIQKSFATHMPPSDELLGFLNNSVEYIYNSMPSSASSPADFYRGADQGWSPIIDGLAITRGMEKKIFEGVISPTEIERGTRTDLVVIKAEAGSGKTVLLRQLAWTGNNAHNGVFLWVNEGCAAEINLVEEICAKANERVFIFWDNSANNFLEILRFVSKAREKKLVVTVITTERYNEWNMRCDGLDQLVSQVYELGYLSENEIEDLLRKLELHNSLGPNLKTKSFEERKKELKEIHGRQLLVALHEATTGMRFEDIVFNEYSNLEPLPAKQIYLTICLLNRLRVPVRAGLISRIHDITFEEFRSRFHAPLERVVFSSQSNGDDVSYSARHPEIAEIVFRRALAKADLRYVEYINVLSKLNISYASDFTSFRQLIKAKSLADLFPSHEDIQRIYEFALNAFGSDAYLLQQMANYERIRINGSLDKAAELLEMALSTSPNDRSILHSISIVWRDKSNRETDPQLRSRYRRQARAHLEHSVKSFGANAFVMSSLIELALNDLADLLDDESEQQNVIDEAVRNVQRKISENKQIFPDDTHIFSLEARMSELLNDHKRTREAIEKSFEANDREPYLAIRLATIYQGEGRNEDAIDIVKKALERRRGDHKLNFHLAELLRKHTDNDLARLIYHYKRAFTPGDRHYQAQFWFARFGSESPDAKVKADSSQMFDELRNARLSHAQRIQIRDYNGGSEKPRRFLGTIIRKREGFGFVRVDGSGEEVFCPSTAIEEGLWDAVSELDRISFNIGYSMKGAVCCHMSPE